MERKTNLRKLSVFVISFLLLAFTVPAISWSPELPGTGRVVSSPAKAPLAQPAEEKKRHEVTGFQQPLITRTTSFCVVVVVRVDVYVYTAHVEPRFEGTTLRLVH